MTFNPMDLAGKCILVTGASSGIGREVAILLSELGARVVVSGRNQERLAQTLAALSGEGHLAAPFDLGAVEGIGDWVKGLVKQTGPLDGLVHSAGARYTVPLKVERIARVDEVMRVNFTSAVMLAKAFRQAGCSSRDSSIVFLSSVTAFQGEPGTAVYAASKAALTGLTKSLAMEFAGDRVRVNCVAPACVKSEMLERLRDMLTPEQYAAVEAMHPLGLGEPRDVANAVAFLLAGTGRWITGSVMVVDGGYSAR